jgi:hypothetical protein
MTRDESRYYVPEYSRPVTGGRKPFRSEVITDRKERFATLNKYVTARNGWLTSIPGEREVTMECLPESSLPDELEKLGYKLEPEGAGERILPHAGIVRVLRFAFDMP